MGPGKRDILERVSWWLTLTACLTALLACIVAPLLAISWSKRPFPGFMIEPTLVVNDSDGEGWSSQSADFGAGQLVVRIAGQTVTTPAEYDAVIAEPRCRSADVDLHPLAGWVGAPLSRNKAHAFPAAQICCGCSGCPTSSDWPILSLERGSTECGGIRDPGARSPSSASVYRPRVLSSLIRRRRMLDQPFGLWRSPCSAGRC